MYVSYPIALTASSFYYQVYIICCKPRRKIDMGNFPFSKALRFPAAAAVEMEVQVGIYLTITALDTEGVFCYPSAVFYLMYQRIFLKRFYSAVQGGPV